MIKQEKVYCGLFKCVVNKNKGNICCFYCPEKENCIESCLNTPEKCKQAYKENR